MIARDLTPTGENWQGKIEELATLLETVRAELVDAEAELAERVAELNAFDFRVRYHLGKLTTRLQQLEDEIRELRRQLRRRAYEQMVDIAGEHWQWATADFDAGESGGYRYMGEVHATPAPELDTTDRNRLKQLYRQLAFRFHPDMAQNAEDRAYRTNIMAKINAAYAAGDWEALEQLALEPDSVSVNAPNTSQALAEALYQELGRLRRRLAEIKEELARLEQHERTKLMRKSQRAAQNGRDLLAELAAELKLVIAQRLVERDVLQVELEESVNEPTLTEADFADQVWEMMLDDGYEEDLTAEYERFVHGRRDPYEADDDILDDSE